MTKNDILNKAKEFANEHRTQIILGCAGVTAASIFVAGFHVGLLKACKYDVKGMFNAEGYIYPKVCDINGKDDNIGIILKAVNKYGVANSVVGIYTTEQTINILKNLCQAVADTTGKTVHLSME